MMPDNVIFYQAAYIAIAVLYAAYAISVVLRRRSLGRRAREAAERR